MVQRRAMAVIEPKSVLEGAGVRLKRSFPTGRLDYLDPFLLFDDFSSQSPEDFVRGFPMHPHRGIETVTYILAGRVSHRDSIGNAGKIGVGDVQWMTSGRGIMHEEMPDSGDGVLTGFQLWVNLPARLKMTRPRYQEIASRNIPEVELDGGTKVRVIAGSVNGIQGPVKEIYADPTYLDVSVPAGSVMTHPVDEGHTVFAYVFQGGARFSGDDETQMVQYPRLVSFADVRTVRVRTEQAPVRFLLVSGKPLNEPVARYGPFVMNTKEEIEQTLRDLRNGTFIESEPGG
jgi:hypothetical protein